MASPESKYEVKEGAEELRDDFSTGLFQCCAQPGGFARCCMVTCCSTCAFATEVGRFPSGSFCCAGSCPLAFFTYALCTCGNGHWDPILGWMIRCPARANVRRITGIKERDGRDCLVSCFCSYCATCQELRELDILEAKLLKQDELNAIALEKSRREQMSLAAPKLMSSPSRDEHTPDKGKGKAVE